jgi:hypothetical protein
MDARGGRTVVSGLSGTRSQVRSRGEKMRDAQCRATEKSMVSCREALGAHSSWGCGNAHECVRVKAEGFINSTTRA